MPSTSKPFGLLRGTILYILIPAVLFSCNSPRLTPEWVVYREGRLAMVPFVVSDSDNSKLSGWMVLRHGQVGFRTTQYFGNDSLSSGPYVRKWKGKFEFKRSSGGYDADSFIATHPKYVDVLTHSLVGARMVDKLGLDGINGGRNGVVSFFIDDEAMIHFTDSVSVEEDSMLDVVRPGWYRRH